MASAASPRIALVTGGNRGIGLACCKALSSVADTVIMGTRSLANGTAALESDVLSGVSNVVPMEVDVSSDTSVAGFVAEVEAAYGGRIDILVNNAGIAGEDTWWKPLGESAMDDFANTFNVNTLSAVRMMQAFVPGMVDRGFGRVINMSSGLGQLSEMGKGSAPYRLSKAALNAATRIMAAEVGDASGVVITAMCPGYVNTEINGNTGTRSPDEPAEVVAWLASLPSDTALHGKFIRDKQVLDW